MSMTTNKQTLRIPQRESHNWGQSVMHNCDFCGHYKMTVTNEDGEHICASCCDAGYVTALTCALEIVIERMEAAERRNAELEANNDLAHEALLKARRRNVTLPTSYSVRQGHPINEAERSVMIPKDNGPWLSRHDVEHALRVAGISIAAVTDKGE